MQKVCLCVPSYGPQIDDWWSPLVMQASELHNHDIELTSVQATSAMMIDLARNSMAREGLKTAAEWFWMVDSDNIHQRGTLRRLLDTAVGRTMVTGVYLKRSGDPVPIVYLKEADGRYSSLPEHRRGEILPVDAAGLGGCVIHRSVFEDIDKAYRVLNGAGGRRVVVHKDDIIGDIFDGTIDELDGKVVDGVMRERLVIPKDKIEVPFFMLEGGRTEDYGFFEKAARCGHQLWCDTGVELGHIGEDFRMPVQFHQWIREGGGNGR